MTPLEGNVGFTPESGKRVAGLRRSLSPTADMGSLFDILGVSMAYQTRPIAA